MKTAKSESPARQLARFLAKYSPAAARDARAALAILRKRLPGAIQLVYDNYNALVIGFGPTERPSEAILSIAVLPRHVSLCFLQNASKLPDPQKLLLGSGKIARHVKLKNAKHLDDPNVKQLITEALRRAPIRIDPDGRGKLIIKSISAKQRPRR